MASGSMIHSASYVANAYCGNHPRKKTMFARGPVQLKPPVNNQNQEYAIANGIIRFRRETAREGFHVNGSCIVWKNL